MEVDIEREHHLSHDPPHGFWETLLADAPWNAKSVVAAGAATVAGLASWVTDYSSPAVARFGGSYVGGFFIGWAFRRFLRIGTLIAGAAMAAIAMLKSTGWVEVDWPSVEAQISQGITAVHHGAEGLKQAVSGYLPSAGAAAAGVFFGFRKK
ncbi:hypothetical protein W02_40200 [Nitrospira sp. KM1]|uniref:FUN14 domain-containing protein n=1 Tax=Nitrospira sp. KM1 TaxID=1936990 RepID=UPI0013A745DC|nr:FUN14 domain-containing protein [Nitrospira sp. KM1]BCA56880.1 hypothetical protein W02_40200 [Nitrospira sp. KM1]